MEYWLRSKRLARLAVAGMLAATAACQRSETSEAAGRGNVQYVASCSTCHGPEGNGVKGLGKSLVTSTYVKQRSNEELAAMIHEGREADDPLNSTGVVMPPKGGNAALTEADVLDIVAFLRTINKVD